MWLFLESRAQGISVFCSLVIWTISLFAQLLTLTLFKFPRRCNLPDPYRSPKFRLVMTSSPVFLPSIHLTQFDQTNSLGPKTTSTPPRIKFVVFPVSIMMLLKHLIRTRLIYLSMFRSCHESLGTNGCFDLITLEISSLKSLSPDLLCLLRHFSFRGFEPAAQNSYWYRTNDYQSGGNDHS
jgi:hypothetical protein